MSSYQGRASLPTRFRIVLLSVLQTAGLPFSDVLSEDEIEASIDEANASFAEGEDDVYTPAITLWAFLSQVLNAEEARSCLATVARVSVLLVQLGREPCCRNNGAYCKARAKFPEIVIERMAIQV